MKRLLHVVRDREPAALEPHDWVVYGEGDAWRLDPHGAPPMPPGPIDAAQLHDLVFAADSVVTW